MKFGLQVYTVRDEISKGIEAAFKALKEIGYENVELYDLLGKTPADFYSMLSHIGLKSAAIMFSPTQLTDNINDVISACLTMDCKYVVCPYIAEEYRSVEGYTSLAGTLEKVAEILSKEGITLCYHNHAFEFDKLDDGACGYDILMNNTSKLCFEPDVYWFAFAGRDLLEMMKKLNGRMPLVHLKDMSAGEDKNFCEVGRGILPMSEIIELVQSQGVDYAFVEQDANWIDNDAMKSVKISIEGLELQAVSSTDS